MEKKSILLVHVMFRHGERYPDKEFKYPNHPRMNETYYPHGPGQLTKQGKISMFELGRYLRTKYDDFLGCTFMPGALDSWSTEFDRAKNSLQLVQASLYPPQGDQIWNKDIHWHPIPYNYRPRNQDTLLSTPLSSSEYMKEYNEYSNTPAVRSIMDDNKDILAYLEENTGLEMNTTRNAWVVLLTVGVERPLLEWYQAIDPDIVTKLVSLEYSCQTATKQLKKLVVGELLEKILKDTLNKINGQSDCKMHLYSVHEFNLAAMLSVLDQLYPHIPGYAACILLEVHHIEDVYGIKVFYKESEKSDIKLLTHPVHGNFLTLSTFTKIVEDIMC